MPALTGPGGAAGITPADYFHPRAVTLSRGGVTVTLPNNPTSYQGKFGVVVTNRSSLDGIVTTVWANEVDDFTLVGHTAWEGLSVLAVVKRAMRGKTDVRYRNDLDPTNNGNVLVKDVRWRTVDGTVMTWEYTLTLQRCARLADSVAQ